MSCPSTGCKREKIDAWFAEHPALGLTVLLQSSFVQPMCHRRAKMFGLDLKAAKGDPMVDLDPLPGEVADLEGRLIEQHLRTHGERPPWNEMGGSVAGAAQVAGLEPDDLFAVLAGVKDNPLVARLTIRELAEDSTAMTFEDHLHTARIRAVMFGAPGSSVGPAEMRKHLDRLPDPATTRARIYESNYLARPAPFNVL